MKDELTRKTYVCLGLESGKPPMAIDEEFTVKKKGLERHFVVKTTYIFDFDPQKKFDFETEMENKSVDQDYTAYETDYSDVATATKTEVDEKYHEAIAIAQASGKTSVNDVQKYFGIGYDRAKAIIDQMDKEGYLAPQTKKNTKRDVLHPVRR